MDDLSRDKLFNEGIKEKIEDLGDNDIYFRYGKLIAKGELVFESKLADNAASLTKLLAKHHGMPKKGSLDW